MRKSAMCIARKRDPKWNSASVGCYEAATDFGSRFGLHSPNTINVSIVRTLDVKFNSLMAMVAYV